MSIRSRLASGWFILLLLLGLSPVIAGETGPGQGSLMEDVQTITHYYDRVKQRMNPGRKGGEGKPPSTRPDRQTPPPTLPLAENSIPNGERQPFTTISPPGVNISEGGMSGYRMGKRDPFSPTSRILQAASDGGGGVVFQPLQQKTKIPRMYLRGLIEDVDGGVAAILEIEKGGVHIVREQDTIGLYEMGASSVIRVRKINRLNIVVEAGSLGQLIIVR